MTDNIPTRSSFLFPSKTETSKMSFLIVSPTFAPRKTAPHDSKMIARTHAVFIEIVFEPTVVPKEFATSFAPTAKARMKAIINAATTRFAALKE
jgi:hypothetical protein